MIIFNKSKQYFEHSANELEKYSNAKLTKSNLNETQIAIITEITFNVIDQILDTYSDCLGDGLLLLKIIKNGEKHLNYIGHLEMGTWLIYASEQPYDLNGLPAIVPRIYHLCAKNDIYVDRMKLNKLQNGKISLEQINEIQQIVLDLVNQSIKDVENSHIYKERKKRGELFTDRELLYKYFPDIISEIEGKDNHNSIKKSGSANKKRKIEHISKTKGLEV